MRAVCFVKRLEFEFVGNVFQNALALGDVDNDGRNELIVGNLNGDLSIFKNDRLWQKFSGLGMITAIAVGDVLNNQTNALVVISGDGWCHILLSNSKVNKDDAAGQKKVKLESFYVQRIPANTKVALLADIDGDGKIELVIGLTDRIVRSYRWLPATDGSDSRLLGLNKWECANQIGTVTMNYSIDGTACLLVAQPGGTLMKIVCHNKSDIDDRDVSKVDRDGLADSSVDYIPLSYSRMRNSNVSTEILGGLRISKENSAKACATRYAVATLDGTIMLVDDEEILWSMQVDHQVFAIKSLDVVGDGSDEIVACAWDGQTYILDQNRRSVRFQLEEAVAGFTAGLYAVKQGEHPQPCIIYTTFTNKVYVYHNVQIPSMVADSFQPQVGLDPQQTRQLVEWCLYHPR